MLTQQTVQWSVGGAALLVMMSTFGAGSPETHAASATNSQQVERGRYLVQAMGCHDCHTPKKMGPQGPEPDMSRALSGHPEGAAMPAPPKSTGPWMASAAWDLTAWAGPWGVSYPINLTPDETTGLGVWTEEIFIKSMRTGRHMGTSRPILPPMPWQSVAGLEDGDIKAVYAYLRSLPPVKNRVPEPVLAEPPAN